MLKLPALMTYQCASNSSDISGQASQNVNNPLHSMTTQQNQSSSPPILPPTLPPPQNQRAPYNTPVNNNNSSLPYLSRSSQTSMLVSTVQPLVQVPNHLRLPTMNRNPNSESMMRDFGPSSSSSHHSYGFRYPNEPNNGPPTKNLVSTLAYSSQQHQQQQSQQQQENNHFTSFQDLLSEGQHSSTHNPYHSKNRSATFPPPLYTGTNNGVNGVNGVSSGTGIRSSLAHDYYEPSPYPGYSTPPNSTSEPRFHQIGRPSYSTAQSPPSSLSQSYFGLSPSVTQPFYPPSGGPSAQYSLPPVTTPNHYPNGLYMSNPGPGSTSPISNQGMPRLHPGVTRTESPESENAGEGYGSNSDEDTFEGSNGTWPFGSIGTVSNPSSPVGQYFPPNALGQYSRRYSITGEGVVPPNGIGGMDPSHYPHYLRQFHYKLPLTDRPFKCDKCPQSFNRNHDLKRHKRIHLSVKPFPCPTCEKQFSRKDALKRHILVKRCGQVPPMVPKGEPSKPRASLSDSEL